MFQLYLLILHYYFPSALCFSSPGFAQCPNGMLTQNRTWPEWVEMLCGVGEGIDPFNSRNVMAVLLKRWIWMHSHWQEMWRDTQSEYQDFCSILKTFLAWVFIAMHHEWSEMHNRPYGISLVCNHYLATTIAQLHNCTTALLFSRIPLLLVFLKASSNVRHGAYDSDSRAPC